MKLFVDGEEIELNVPEGRVVQAGDRLLVTTPQGTHSALVIRKGDALLISYRGCQYTVSQRQLHTRSTTQDSNGELRAPMPGQIVDVRTQIGETVKKGQVLLVLEAMKTQQPFAAPFDGCVEALTVSVGQLVQEGAVLVKVVQTT